MADVFTETTRTGCLGNLGSSIKGVFVGILFFLGSFPLLWQVEGCVNLGEVAKTSKVAPADRPEPALDGQLISVTQKLEAEEPLGDPRYLKPGPYVSLERHAETYAWVEEKHERTEKQTGGGSTTTTTYTYEKKWTAHPKRGSEFKHPQGHDNPEPRETSDSFVVREATVGAYAFAPADTEGGFLGAGLPSGERLNLTEGDLAFAAEETAGADSVRPRLMESHVFLGTGTPASPNLGDTRIWFVALPTGRMVTLFGKQAVTDKSGGRVESWMHEGETKFFRAVAGDRDTAIQALLTEHSIKVWLGRGLGFFLMWAGMCLVFGPLSAVLDVLPFLGNASRSVVSLVMFPIAAVLTLVTVMVAKVFHSPIALAAVVGVVLVGGVMTMKKKTARP